MTNEPRYFQKRLLTIVTNAFRSFRMRLSMTLLGSIVVSALASMKSDFGFLNYSSKDMMSLVLPITGTIFALALPAAQLAESVKEKIIFEGDYLLKTRRPEELATIVTYLEGMVSRFRASLDAMRLATYLSLASLLVGIMWMFGVADGIGRVGFSGGEAFLACLSTSLLVAAALWFFPVISSAFDFGKIDQFINALRNSPASSPREGDDTKGGAGNASAQGAAAGGAVLKPDREASRP